jgi:hypothetical protein
MRHDWARHEKYVTQNQRGVNKRHVRSSLSFHVVVSVRGAIKMNSRLIAAAAAGLLSAAPAFSTQVTIDFESAPTSFQPIGDTYLPLGVSFGGDLLAVRNDALGPYFSHAPTPGTIMAPLGAGNDTAMNAGPNASFIDNVTFYYSSAADTTVTIWSGLNGTGSVLGTFNLTANAQNGCADSPACHWDASSVSFSGNARSIQFGNAIGQGFDNITVNAVPLPAAAWLLISGLGGLGSLVRRRREA